MNSDLLKDLRWSYYKETFHTLPNYYFNSLQYPETYEQAALILRSLELDMQNIDSQFVEREVEVLGQGNLSPEEKQEYDQWKTKAIRAQKMKLSQIKLIEAWMLDNPPLYVESLKTLTRRVEALEQHLGLPYQHD